MKDRKVEAQPAPKAKPVIAIEYAGQLYPSFQTAEGARAKSELIGLLCHPRDRTSFDHHGMFIEHGQHKAIDSMVEHAERVHGILSRYLDAAKIETPSNL